MGRWSRLQYEQKEGILWSKYRGAPQFFISIVEQCGVTKAKVFDVLLVATYLSNGITSIYTYNAKDFERLGVVSVWTP